MNDTQINVTGHYVMVEGTRTYYDQSGDKGPTIVCIHTAAACNSQFFDFIQIMSKKGFRVIAMDMPGHGKSYPRNWEPIRNPYDYADFIWKFAKAVCPNEKPIICGSSVGGVIALHMAGKYSDGMKALISLEGIPYAGTGQWSRFCGLWEHPHAMPSWRDVMERAAMSGLYNLSGDRLEELRWHHRYCAQEIGTGDLQCWAFNDCRELLPKITCPTLAFKGEADYWVPEESLDEIVAKVPNGLAEKCVGQGMGHYPMFERPEALADTIHDFLKRRKIV